MTKINSFDFSLQKRQVLEAFQLYLQEKSSALGIFLRNGLREQAGTNNKYEWLESQLTPKAWTVNGAVVGWTLDTTTPATITFVSTAGMRVDDTIRFVDWTTKSPVGNIVIRIVAITNSTQATAVIHGWADITIPDWAEAKYIANLVEENKSVFEAGNDWEPVAEYNYFQIFDETVSLSDTAINSLMYGNPSQIVSQMRQAMYKMEQKMSEAMIYGFRVARTGSTGAGKWSLGGLRFFFNQAEWNVKDASSGALTPTLINDVIEEVKKDWWDVNTIMCNYNQARKISAFNTSGNNPLIQRNETSAWSYVMRFISDIPVAWWLVNSIIVDEKMPNNELYLLDMNKVALVPFANRSLKMVDWTSNGQDGKTMILRWEYTLKVDSAKYSAWTIKNLAL